jgi:UDP-N-acetylmuramoylalanine--D-glutamate ligase
MKKALVIGLGISGCSAAELLLSKGFQVTGVDKNLLKIKKEPRVSRLKTLGLHVQQEDDPIDWKKISLVIISPGVPRDHPLFCRAKEHHIETIDEVELAFRYLDQKAAGITGTNGKTTVTLLIEHILNASGYKAKALGNIGEPLALYALHPNPQEIIVAELSSYQLETMKAKVLDAAVVLNITPDHLDRYSSMEEYAKAKLKIAPLLKTSKSPLYLHEHIPADFSSLTKGISFKTFGHLGGSFLSTDKTVFKQGETVEYFLPLRYREELGMHESENALAAWAIVKEFGVTPEQFGKGLESFTKPAHRIEFVKEIDGVCYFDDSKGTNIDATIKAVNTMKGPVILIAGGVDKGASYQPWKTDFSQKIKKIIAIGQAAKKIHSELNDSFSVELTDSMQKAVELAAGESEAGDCVLLSPGCSSFDMFRDYAHRGEEFKQQVIHLEERSKR